MAALYTAMHYDNQRIFHGGAGNTGAQKSAIGLQQAMAYWREVGISPKLIPTRSKFIFGDNASGRLDLGGINVLLLAPKGARSIHTHVIRVRILFLTGLEALYCHKCNLLTVKNKVQYVT